jgi:kexin
MHIHWTLLLSVLLAHTVGSTPARRTYDTHDYYVVEHCPNTPGGASLGDVARALGVELVEQAGELRDHWLVRIPKPEVNKRGEGGSDPVVAAFDNLRQKAASGLAARDSDHARGVVSSVRFLSRQELRQREKRAPPPVRPPRFPTLKSVMEDFGIRDPLFSQQWHIVNEENPEHMMNVTGVWEMGLTGKGVLSSLIDDGLDYTHDDLAANFVCFALFVKVSF